MNRPETAAWVKALIGRDPADPQQFTRALTHGSHGAANYERLEFLGDRVLGLVMAEWLFTSFPDEPEGTLSRRFNALVSGDTCADIARAIGLPAHVRLGKQARDDGARDSSNVLGDVLEALIGALYLDAGMDTARDLIRRLWAERLHGQATAPRHPKSALQEWAAANRRKPPVYALEAASGPQHSPRFRVSVAIKGAGEAIGEGSSKQEAETEAARNLMSQLT